MIFRVLYWMVAGLFLFFGAWMLLFPSTYPSPTAGLVTEEGTGTRLLALAIAALVIWVVELFLVRLPLLLVGAFLPTKEVIEDILLASLKDTSGLAGRFFLGTGSIGDAGYYVFYKKLEDGGYIRSRVHDWEATVYEEERADGVLRYTRRRWSKPWFRWFAEEPRRDARLSFHIPKGSVQQEFVLDTV